MKKTYAVFGLGRYGMAVASELEARGAEVVAIDIDPAAVEEAASSLTVCKCADITDRKVAEQLGISQAAVMKILKRHGYCLKNGALVKTE